MEVYYLINDRKYLDSYLVRKNLNLNKSEFQHIMNRYAFPPSEMVRLQNKRLYSLTGLTHFLEMILEKE